MPANPFDATPAVAANPFDAVGTATKVRPPPAARKPKAFHDPSFFQHVMAWSQWAANSPVARGLDAVVNAPGRAVMGGTAAGLEAHGDVGAVGRGAVKNVTAPGDATHVTHLAEQAMGIPQPLAGAKAMHLDALLAPAGVLQAIEDFGVETFLDPVTYVPGLDLFQIGKRLYRISQAGRLVRAAEKIAVVDRALSQVVEGRELRKSVTRAGEDIVKSNEGGAANALRRQEQAYGDLIERNRPELEAIDEQRTSLYEQLRAPDIPPEAKKALQGQIAALNASVPTEVRTALLQRAYREGTPQVRRQVLAAGYKATAEDRAQGPLNILHKFRDEYEPTQHIFSPEEIAASGGSVRYVHQGNRRATFDLPKAGGRPEDPLADRLLDRLVRGSRLESYHATRRTILTQLGVLPQGDASKLTEAYAKAVESGDTRRAGLIATALRKFNETAKTAEAARARTLVPNAPEVERRLELTAPGTAAERALRAAKRAGTPGTLDAATDATGKQKGFLRQLAQPPAPIAETRGKAKALIANLPGQRIAARVSQEAVERTGSAAQKAATDAAQRVQKVLAPQSARVAALGAKIEESETLRAGLRSDLPAIRAQAREALEGFRTAQALTRGIYQSGAGRDVDAVLNEIAERRMDRPAGTSLSTYETSGGDVRTLGSSSSFHGTPYTKAEVASARGALQRAAGGGRKAPRVTAEEAVRHLDEAQNAIGPARQRLAAIAEKYSVEGRHLGPAFLGDQLKAMRNEVKAYEADLRKQVAAKPPVPGWLAKQTKKIVAEQPKIESALSSELAGGEPAKSARTLKSIVAPAERSAKFSAALVERQKQRATAVAHSLRSKLDRNDVIGEARRAGQEAIDEGNLFMIPETLDKRLFGDKVVYERGLRAAFSDLQRDALFVVPFAHMKNIAALAALGPGGLKTLARGMKYAHDLRVNSTTLEGRVRGLEGVGATTHYIREADPAYASLPGIGAPLQKIGKVGNEALERYDTGMRLALEDELRARGVTDPMTVAGQIRDVLGDYTNHAPMIEKLRTQFGANFPGWRLGVVPRAMTKAVLERPRQVHALARAERLTSDDVTVPLWGTDVDLGGPLEDYTKMLDVPEGSKRFFASPSTIGPIGLLPQLSDALKRGQVGPLLGREALQFVPGGNLTGAALNFPFPSNAPAAARVGSGLAGIYYPNAMPRNKRAAQLRQLGMKGADIRDQLRREGYGAAQPPNPALGNPFNAPHTANPFDAH
jgi:hypothetical protein